MPRTESIRLLEESKKIPLLSAAEEMALAREGTPEARQKLVTSNLRLIARLASRHVGRGLSFEDLVQEGTFGLMRAAEKYDPSLGFRFSTYALHWIRAAVGRASDDTGPEIRLPAHLAEDLRRVRRVSDQLHGQLGRMPTIEEIAHGSRLTPARVVDLLASRVTVRSASTPLEDGSDRELGDAFHDEDAVSPEDLLDARAMAEDVRALVAQLPDRERYILTLRFGLGEHRSHTLDEVGTLIGRTRERVRQLERGALERLRALASRRRLPDYLELERDDDRQASRQRARVHRERGASGA